MRTSPAGISVPWRVAIFGFCAAALNYADRAALFSVIPPLRAEMGITDVEVGLAGSLFLWAYALASPIAGVIADRFSRRRIVLLSLVSWSVVTVATGCVTNVGQLLVLRVVLGLTESLYLPAAAALLGDLHESGTRGKAMGLHLLGLNLGVLLGGAVAGSLAELYGWRWGFWILGGAGLGLALIYKGYVFPAGFAEEARTVSTGQGTMKEAYAYLVRIPSVYVMLLSAMIAGVASWVLLTWLPLYFRESFAMNLGAAGFISLALFKLPGALGIAVGGWLSDRVARRAAKNRVLIKALSFLVSAPMLLLFITNPTLLLAAIILVTSSIIRALGTPSEHPIVCDLVPARFRASAVGLLNMCGSAAGGLGVLLAGVFKQDVGLGAIFAAAAVLFVFAGLVVLLAYRWFVDRDVATAAAHARPAAV